MINVLSSSEETKLKEKDPSNFRKLLIVLSSKISFTSFKMKLSAYASVYSLYFCSTNFDN